MKAAFGGASIDEIVLEQSCDGRFAGRAICRSGGTARLDREVV